MSIEPEIKTFVDKENWLTYRHWQDNEAVMSFEVYEIDSMSTDKQEVYYAERGKPSFEGTQDILDATVSISGYIKWDGCTNYVFGDRMNHDIHGCGNPGKKLKLIFDTLYSIANKEMPGNEEYLDEDEE